MCVKSATIVCKAMCLDTWCCVKFLKSRSDAFWQIVTVLKGNRVGKAALCSPLSEWTPISFARHPLRRVTSENGFKISNVDELIGLPS